jgi:hypothetical protein
MFNDNRYGTLLLNKEEGSKRRRIKTKELRKGGGDKGEY